MPRVTRLLPKSYRKAINDLEARLATVETQLATAQSQLGTLQVGDISGATDGQQLTFEDSGDTWVPGDPNPE